MLRLQRSRIPSLTEPDFRLLLVGDNIYYVGETMAEIARLWLVLELTGSPLLLGTTAFASGVPRLALGIVAGVIADRLDRRRIVITCAVANLALQLLFATLVFAGAVSVWQIIAIVLVTAVLETMITVARQALLPETVSPENFPNAMALFITVRRTLQIVAPSVAGIAIVTLGVAGVLYVNVVAIGLMLITLGRMRSRGGPVGAMALGLREDVSRGFAFVRAQPNLVAIFLLATIPILLLDPYKPLMPVFARDVLGVGAAGYGLLMAAPGAGGLIGAALLTLVGSAKPGLLMLVSLVGVSGAMLAFSMSSSFVPALVAMSIVGMGLNIYKILNQTLLQSLTPRDMMGRVLGIYRMDKGLEPFGALALGSAASIVGAPVAVGGAAVVSGLCATAVLLLRPSLRELQISVRRAPATIGNTIPPTD